MWGAAIFFVCAALSYMMLKDSPPRFPKLAVILAAIAGGGLVGWARSWIVGAFSWVESAGVRVFGVSVLLVLFVVLLYKVLNGLMPKAGKVAGGSVKPSYAVLAFLLPVLGAMVGGGLADVVLGLVDTGGSAIARLTSGWL